MLVVRGLGGGVVPAPSSSSSSLPSLPLLLRCWCPLSSSAAAAAAGGARGGARHLPLPLATDPGHWLEADVAPARPLCARPAGRGRRHLGPALQRTDPRLPGRPAGDQVWNEGLQVGGECWCSSGGGGGASARQSPPGARCTIITSSIAACYSPTHMPAWPAPSLAEQCRPDVGVRWRHPASVFQLRGPRVGWRGAAHAAGGLRGAGGGAGARGC